MQELIAKALSAVQCVLAKKFSIPSCDLHFEDRTHGTITSLQFTGTASGIAVIKGNWVHVRLVDVGPAYVCKINRVYEVELEPSTRESSLATAPVH
jgi:hypothetical protein